MVDYVISLWLNNGERPQLRAPIDGQQHPMTADERLARAIHAAVDLQAANSIPSVNQTCYESVRFAPIAVSIETKQPTGRDDGKVQLGVWTAAWHHRIDQLLRGMVPPQPRDEPRTRHEEEQEEQQQQQVPGQQQQQMPSTSAPASRRIITLPLLLVTGHQWRLYFACDRGYRIEILESLLIGESDRLDRIYKIVASLRALARWVQGPYREWIEESFL
jgi:hypothetical protein